MVFLVCLTLTDIQARPASAQTSRSTHNIGTQEINPSEKLLENDNYFEGDMIVSPELVEEYYGDGTKVSTLESCA